MRITCKFTRFFWVGLMLLTTLIMILPENAILHAKRSVIDDPYQANAIYREGHPKMESVLNHLLEVYYLHGLIEAQEFAEKRGIDMEGDCVRIVAEAQSDRMKGEAAVFAYLRHLWWMQLFDSTDTFQISSSDRVSQQITAYGGRVEMTSRNMVQSVVPLYSLQDLALYSSVRYLRLPKRPIPFVVSEGVAVTGADLWQDTVPYRSSENVKVCILDVGFSGYQALLGTELPSSVTAMSFRSDGDLFVSDHGTACAEIVHDMAPDAELLLVNFGTDVEHRNAVDWIIDQNVDIISCSVGWLNLGAGDGTGPICEDVNNAHDSGIIWISSAGNSGETHWDSSFRDPDLDNWCNFEDPGDPEYEFFEFSVVAGTDYSIYLNWDDWGTWNGSNYIGAEGNDYDLYLYDSGGFVLASSNNDQTAGAPPTEAITYTATSTGFRYIRVYKWWTIRDCQIELFFQDVDSIDSEYQKPSGSVAIPADSPHAVAVGATYWSDDSLELYSSQGPTSDGRIKPDFSAPVGVLSSTYGLAGFFGTSAAAPHVAGAFALLKGKTPFILDDINEILEARAVDLGSTGKDNIYGSGRLSLAEGSGGGTQVRNIQIIDQKTTVSQEKGKILKVKIPKKKKDEDKKKSVIK